MSDLIPTPWEFTILSLALFRLIKLIGDDTILDQPRDWLSDHFGDTFDELITCPWCIGFWLGIPLWASWLLFPDFTVALSTFWALLAVAALIFSVWHAISERTAD